MFFRNSFVSLTNKTYSRPKDLRIISFSHTVKMEGKKEKKTLLCKGFWEKEKNMSEMEIIVEGCHTTVQNFINIITQYKHDKKKKEPSLIGDVNISKLYKKNEIFGCNQEPNAYSNIYGIYFFAKVKKDRVVFSLPKGNLTRMWLLDFCKNYITETTNQLNAP